MRATLLMNVPAGLAKDDDGRIVHASQFVGKSGQVVEVDDTAYDSERPTGYEPVDYLVDFGTAKVWLPSQLYMGDDRRGKEIWHRYLKLER